MFPLARRALGLSARGIQHTVTRQAHRKLEPDFHEKYGNLILLSGVTFGIGMWTYVSIWQTSQQPGSSRNASLHSAAGFVC
uniref:Cytochrome c oxidase subunit 7B, mitochondrial n=1 Tax=Pseudonaja textilis TaxID=8673 RepID=A0A670YZ72_PSETE